MVWQKSHVLWVDAPRWKPRQTSMLRASEPWHARHRRMDHTIALASQSAWNSSAWHTTTDMEEKNTTAFICVVCPTSTHIDWWVQNCDYPTCSDGKKQQMRLRVWLYITSDDISTYHYLEDILDGQSSAQLWNCFHATMGRHQPNRITVSTRTARW